MARLLARIGRLTARFRAATLFAWLGLLAVFGGIALTSMQFDDGGFDVPGTDSSIAMEKLSEEFPSDGSASLQLVVRSTEGGIADSAAAADLQGAYDRLLEIDDVTAVSNPLDPTSSYVSEDGSTAVATISIDEVDAERGEHLVEDAEQAIEPLRDAGYDAEIGGSLAAGPPEIFGPSEVVGALIAFAVLLVTFGSLVAAGANMLGALIGVAVGVTGVLAASSFAPIASITLILGVMLGLAVGIDYCLFIISRFRSELRAGRSVQDAIARANGTAGSAVVFAGATVIIALVGLTVVGIPFIADMGLAAAFSVLVAVLVSLTLLPALLSWMGAKALPRRERRTWAEGAVFEENTPRAIAAWGRGVTRRPVISMLVGVLVLGTMALPITTMQTALATPGGDDPAASQRAAHALVAEEFGDGAQDPLVVLLSSGEGVVEAALPAAQEKISALKNVAMAIPSGISADGDTALLTVQAETGPLEQATEKLVKDLRALDLSDDSVTLSVTGSTALGLDSNEQLDRALITYLAIIVGLSLILLTILFRSILVPIIATLGFLLSLGAALGATTAVFQWGWLDPIVSAPQGNPLMSLLPILVTGILFGLAMDYQVFLVSRIHEAHQRGMRPINAIRTGFDGSASVVIAAAGIMAAVFGGFAMASHPIVASIALALGVGVVADAFVVRMVIVPASLALLGRSAWWIPAWLDRILPKLDVEGHSIDAPATSSGRTAVTTGSNR